jgi:3-hydroxy-9,10-secoandrosta-1,3,5(10)-triene-9,17-dione monooxygenase reductase component
MSDVTRDLFRTVLGHFPTGVTVLTAYSDDDQPIGMAANSLTSLSLDPPLILVCPAKSSRTWQSMRSAERFCINVMASHHEQVTRRFSRKDVDRFAGVATSRRPGGPALHDAVAWIDCRIRTEHDGGDHTIVVADVVALEAAEDASPLVFFRGGYGAFAVPEA